MSPSTEAKTAPSLPHRLPLKQKLVVSLQSLVSSALGNGKTSTPAYNQLFAKTDAATDGEECLRDCESCSVRYPRGFEINEEDVLYGYVKGWSTHLLVGTGKTDWVRDVEDEKGSVMEAIGKGKGPSNGRLMLSASNLPTPNHTADYSQPTTVLLLPAFTMVHNVHPRNVSTLIAEIINKSPTNDSPLQRPSLPASIPSPESDMPALETKACPHSAIILLCSQKKRDARCGQSAPLLRRELERHLRPLGFYRDLHDERPGGVGIYFISHVGGHKYSANVMIYRRPNAFGQDDAVEGPSADGGVTNGLADSAPTDVGAAQCIWLARVRPEDCENLVRYTVLKGKVVKPESQLRGGFDRVKGLTSW